MQAIYVLLAVAHVALELFGGTNLRRFLNLDYYRTGQDHYPVSRFAGVAGPVTVLVVLVLPLFDLDFLLDWWCLALGVLVADTLQHLVHLVLRFRKAAPWLHLVTIVGVLICLFWLNPLLVLDLLTDPCCQWPVVLGALLIFGNWAQNSLRVDRRR